MIKTVVRTAASLASAIALLGSANAAVEVVITESGGGVTATYSGSIDLTGLAEFGSDTQDRAQIGPVSGFVISIPNADVTFWRVPDPWTPFGTGGGVSTGSASGDAFALFTDPALGLPTGYVSGSALSGMVTFAGETFASLGISLGVFTSDLGNGDSVSVIVGDAAPVPVPAAALLFAPAALAFARRRKAA
ncbi:MAG: hypothetical protein AAF830_03605 [Pseudomonadota bacterium]